MWIADMETDNEETTSSNVVCNSNLIYRDDET